VIGPGEVRMKLNLTKRGPQPIKKKCPECGHEFQGNGWDGIDAHWRSRHEDKMHYEDAWPLVKNGTYGSSK
jgi:hypothetical protein